MTYYLIGETLKECLPDEIPVFQALEDLSA